MMKCASASTSSAGEGNAQSTGGLGVVLTIAAGGAGDEEGRARVRAGDKSAIENDSQTRRRVPAAVAHWSESCPFALMSSPS